MKSMNKKLLMSIANILINIGAIGVVKYTIPVQWYEPKVPERLLRSIK